MAKDWKEFERQVAKDLGAWWGCIFRRTPSSGAWNKQGQSRYSKGADAARDFHGDIVAPVEAQFPFSVECKTYKTVEMYLALYGKSNVFDWWQQCKTDAVRAKKIPMLVMKENNKKPLLVIPYKLWEAVELRLVDVPVVYMLRLPSGQRVAILSLAVFLRTCPARWFRRKVC